MPFPAAAVMQSWQGPYPPPEAAERFEALLPGTFNRIMVMAEQAQAAQLLAMKNAIEYQRRDTRRGHVLGFLSSIAAMAGALCCLYFKQAWVASLFVSVPALAIGKSLVDSTHKSKQLPGNGAQPATKGAPPGLS